jgi:hypothetical protein
MKNGCNFETVYDTTKFSTDGRRIDWRHHFWPAMTHAGHFCVCIIKALNKICCVKVLLTQTAIIKIKNFSV